MRPQLNNCNDEYTLGEVYLIRIIKILSLDYLLIGVAAKR